VLKGQRVQAVPLTPHSAAQIVKAYAKRAGLDAQGFAGHSLRSGFLTSAPNAGERRRLQRIAAALNVESEADQGDAGSIASSC
jgi:site-specific recombinase XerD